jgi:hypothetical protein
MEPTTSSAHSSTLQGFDKCIPDPDSETFNGQPSVGLCFHGILFKALKGELMQPPLSLSEKSAMEVLAQGLSGWEEWLAESATDRVTKRITQTRDWFKERKYAALLAYLRDKDLALGRGSAVRLCRAIEHTATMVDVCYTAAPTEQQVDACCNAAIELRKALKALKASCTPWGHIWTVHVPRTGLNSEKQHSQFPFLGSRTQFLLQWGTVYPFLCHGVEAKHRKFKRDLRCSAGNQWKRNWVGFAHVLDLDWVEWELRAAPPRTANAVLSGRSAAFKAHLAKLGVAPRMRVLAVKEGIHN